MDVCLAHLVSVDEGREHGKTTDSDDLHKTTSRDHEPCYSVYKPQDDSKDKRYARNKEV